MRLDTLLERNREFVRRRTARPFPDFESIDLAVIACYDPRLDDMLLPSLGLEQGDAFLFRTAGAFLQPGSSSLRSLTLAVYFFGVKEVVVMGHTSCRMAQFDTSAFIDSFRRRDVRREAFGSEDLRAWAGAMPDPKRGVQMTVANLRLAPFLPRDLEISGVLLDDTTGEIEAVVRPGEVIQGVVVSAATTVPGSVEAAAAAAPGASPAAPAPPAAGPPAPPILGASAAPGVDAPWLKPVGASAPVAPRDPLVEAVTQIADVLRVRAGWRDELRALRTEIDRQHNPLVQLAVLESFVKKVAADSREVHTAIDRLKKELGTAGSRKPAEVIQLLLRLAEGS